MIPASPPGITQPDHRLMVGGMSEAAYGIATARRIRAEKLGDYTVLFNAPWRPQLLSKMIRYCRQHRLRFVMDETWSRLHPRLLDLYAADWNELRAILKQAGEVFDGALFMCEYGGVGLYWPGTSVTGSGNTIPQTDSLAQAKRHYVKRLRGLAKRAVRSGLPRPLVSIEAGGIARYLLEAGIDRVDLEMTYHRQSEWLYAATKGAALAYGRPTFGVDLAMVWYGGNQHGPLWFQRWKTSLYHAFIRGAGPIYAEHGLMNYKALGKDLPTSAPDVQHFRRTLADFVTFTRRHARPTGLPLARIAMLQGNLDSFSLGEKFVWGQRHAGAARAGTAEESWDLYRGLYQRSPWQFPYVDGCRDLSGNPPWGQADVIPVDSPLALLRRYDCLVFLGWNTITEDIHARLTRYVRAGGHLFATLAHLDTRDCRTAPMKLFRKGDLRELFGVQVGRLGTVDDGIKFLANPPGSAYRFPLWTAVCDPKYDDGGFPSATLRLGSATVVAGFSDRFADTAEAVAKRPALTVNRVGKGQAFLVNAAEYPGHRGLRRFSADLLTHVAAAHQQDPLVEAVEQIRFAIYRDGELFVIYLLNTDAGCEHGVRISMGRNRDLPLRIPAGTLAVAYATDRCFAWTLKPQIRVRQLDCQDDLLIICGERAWSRAPQLGCFVDGLRWRGKIRWSPSEACAESRAEGVACR